MTEAKQSPKVRRAPWHEQAVAAFVADTRINDVAAALGKSRRTIIRWRSRPENWEEVVQARGQVLEDTLRRLRNALPGLADRLVAVANDKLTDAPVAVRAIATVFEQFSGLSQRAEFEGRLAQLERALAERSQASIFTGPRRPVLLTATTDQDTADTATRS